MKLKNPLDYPVLTGGWQIDESLSESLQGIFTVNCRLLKQMDMHLLRAE